MSTALFIRHGQTAMAGRFCGHADPDLNDVGRAQAQLLAASLADEPVLRIYSSDLRRARQTAEVLACSKGLPVQVRDALREMSFGLWEERRWAEIEALDPEYASAWLAGFPQVPAPSGERLEAFSKRVLHEVHSILNDCDGLTAVVTHAGVLRLVLTQLLGRSEAEAWAHTQPYCSIVRYTYGAIGEK